MGWGSTTIGTGSYVGTTTAMTDDGRAWALGVSIRGLFRHGDRNLGPDLQNNLHCRKPTGP